MTNTTMLNHLITKYHEFAYTDEYIIGFIYKKVVYYGFMNGRELEKYISLSRASSKNGGGYCTKFTPRNDEKLAMLPNCKVLCSEARFEEICGSNKYNKGENFEKIITEMYGMEWEKDTIPFTMAGDIEINGRAYQVKFQKASFCTEQQIERLSLVG